VARLRAGRSGFQIPARQQVFLFSRPWNRLRDLCRVLFKGLRDSFPG